MLKVAPGFALVRTRSNPCWKLEKGVPFARYTRCLLRLQHTQIFRDGMLIIGLLRLSFPISQSKILLPYALANWRPAGLKPDEDELLTCGSFKPTLGVTADGGNCCTVWIVRRALVKSIVARKWQHAINLVNVTTITHCVPGRWTQYFVKRRGQSQKTSRQQDNTQRPSGLGWNLT